MFMFQSSKRSEASTHESVFPMSTSSAGNGTIIASGVRVEGDFSSQGDVMIEGEVQGKVAITGMLTVGPQARLKADVSSEQAKVSGIIEGNLTIGSHLSLTSTAKIVGDITCATVSIESGAVLQGKVMAGSTSTPSSSSGPGPSKQ